MIYTRSTITARHHLPCILLDGCYGIIMAASATNNILICIYIFFFRRLLFSWSSSEEDESLVISNRKWFSNRITGICVHVGPEGLYGHEVIYQLSLKICKKILSNFFFNSSDSEWRYHLFMHMQNWTEKKIFLLFFAWRSKNTRKENEDKVMDGTGMFRFFGRPLVFSPVSMARQKRPPK